MDEKQYNLTNPQKSIWLTEEYYQGTAINTICGYVYITDTVSLEALKKAIQELVKTNEAMRINLTNENNTYTQYIQEYKEFDIETITLSRKEEIEETALKMANTPLIGESRYLFQFKLFKLPDHTGGFIVNVHHLIGDSWSLGLIAKETTDIYSKIITDTYEETMFPSYLNYIKTEEEYKNSEKWEKDKKYWEEIFQTIPEIPVLTSKRQAPKKEISCTGKREKFILPKEDLSKIENFCNNHKISIYHFFMAAYSIYISKISNLDDFVIGTPVLNRTNFEQKHTMGMFVNAIPLRIKIDNQNSFASLAQKIGTDIMSAFRHQKYSYQSIIEDIRKKDKTIPSLYNIVVSYQITKTIEESKVHYCTDWIFNGNCSDDIQIQLFDLNSENAMTITYDYKDDKFDSQEITALHQRVLTIIHQILNDNNLLLKDVEVVTPEEKHHILYNFNNTEVEYPKDKTIVDLFEEQVEKTPNNIAVIFENQKTTYQELNQKANKLARMIKSLNIPTSSSIGILLKRSIDIYVCMLGILKSNHSYILIDSTLPNERIEYMLNNSNSTIVLTSSSISKDISTQHIINIDKVKFDYNDANLKEKITPSSPSCIIYTSGSTGKPKGVMLTHRGIVNMLISHKKLLHTDKLQNFFSMSTISFDMFTVETYVPLLAGGTIILTSESEQQSPQKLQELIMNYHVDFILTTPSKMELLMMDEEKDCLKDVKTIQLGGEVFNSSLYTKLQERTNAELYNGYGPTEITACCSMKRVDSADISIGTPLCNTKIVICDKDLNLLPIGAVGELCVSGDGMSLGYVNNEELTKKSFVKSKYFDKTLYRTGDLAYLDKSGEIKYVKRNDNQVKLRGLRIELGEIASRIKEINGVKNAVAVIKEVNGTKTICAYISVKKTVKINAKDIKKYLQQYLPNYMIPSFITFLEEIPLTINGKIDTRKLPGITLDNQEIEQASTKTEIELEAICKKYIESTNIDINTSLFEIGGDSLFAIKLSAEIFSKFHVTITVKEIFDYPSIKELANRIDKLTNKNVSNTIQKAQTRTYYPASFAQKRIYYASKSDSNSTFYNTTGGIILDKMLDIVLLEKCFQTLIDRHEALRTHFKIVENDIVQIIEEKIDFKLSCENQEERSLKEITNAFIKPFDLEKDILIRAKVVKLKSHKMLLLLDMHHIISDGTSVTILIQELCDLYNGKLLPEKQIDYKDYSLWEKEQIKTKEYQKAKEFWLNEYQDEIPSLNMPTTYQRPSVQSFEGDSLTVKLSKAEYEKINQIAKELEITPYMLMLSIYYILLSRYTSQEDIIVGTPIIGRQLPELTNMVGMFVNTLVLRNKIDDSLKFEEFAKTIKEYCLNAFQNQTYPFDELVKELHIKKDASRNALFDVMFVYQNDGYPKVNFKDTKAEYYIPENKISKFDLSLEITPIEGEYLLRYEYSTKLFDKDYIQRLAGHYKNILMNVLAKPETQIANINMLSKEEKNQILNEFNNTDVNYPKEKNIVDLFEEQVEKSPNNIAVVFENQKLTYRELNEKANGLARRLVHLKHGTNIGILLKRSINIYVCMLAALKSNHNYMLIDEKLPIDRIEYMLKNSNSTALLTESSNNKKIEINPTIYIDKEEFDFDNNNLQEDIKPESASCIIYTSGSTGMPKGVMLTHKGIINMVLSYKQILHTDKLKNFFSMSTVSFDMFAVETYIALLTGGTIILTSETDQQSPQNLQDLIIKHQVEFILTTPSKVELLMMDEEKNCLKNVKIIQLGGEVFSGALYKKLCKFTNADIYNGYGPTEITACCSTKKVTNEDISIGTPFCNTKIFICDKNLNLLPIGAIGELCVAGEGISLGYINNEELTKKSFVKSKWIDQMLYKTGDLAYFDKSGEIHYIGRRDNQVKLRGLRIELGEISARIKEIKGVKNSITLIKEVNGNKAICAYICTEEESNLNAADIKNEIKQYLPNYMIPNFIMFLKEMPLTLNGKIDTRKLPEIIFDKSTITHASTKQEIELEKICKKYLKCDEIDINSSLFDIGGDSLFAIKLGTEIDQYFNTTITVKEIFEHPSIKELAKYITTVSENKAKNTIPKAEKSSYYPTSSAQRRIYYASKVEENSTLYNVSGGIILDKPLEIEKLQKCFQILIDKHEALRTHFSIVNENIVQIVENKIDFTLMYEKADTEDTNQIYKEFIKPFDLSKPPLIRAKAVSLPSHKMLLLIDMHHIISDGTTVGILLQELCELYNGNTLPENKIDYTDYSVWESKQNQTQSYQKAKEFWLKEYQKEIPLLNMQTTYQRPSVQSFEGNNYYTELPKETFEKINKVAKELGITPYMLMLSVYYVLLSKYTSQEDIVVGTPIVGRQNPELTNMVGMFVNTLALRNKIENTLSFRKLARQIKQHCLLAFQNQNYPFDELVKELHIKKDASRSALFDVMFIYQNDGYPKINFKDRTAQYYIPEDKIAKFDLSLEVIPVEEKYRLRYEYCTKLFDETLIKRLASHYENILMTILNNPEEIVENVEILSKEEIQKLNEFNNTEENYPKDKSIVDLFEKQVEKSPNNIAVVFQDKKLTYQELNEKANSLARKLMENGIKNESIVGIMLPRSLEMIISMMAILKTGAAYLPLDPTYPKNRIKYIVKDSGVELLLTKNKQETITLENVKTLDVSLDSNIYAKYEKTNINNKIVSNNLAYVIYTSGSTGNPKGVGITHQNVNNFVKGVSDKIKLEQVIVSVTTICFDIFVLESILPLQKGLTIILASEEEQTIPEKLNQLCIKNHVTMIQTTPSKFSLLISDETSLDFLKNMKVIMLGGEAFPNNLLTKIKELTKSKIYNMYGPTETTVWSSIKDLTNTNDITIGKPIANTTMYILDNKLKRLPINTIGKLYIGGDGVSKRIFTQTRTNRK